MKKTDFLAQNALTHVFVTLFFHSWVMAIVFFLMLACLGFGTVVGMVMVIVECFSEWLDHRKQPFKKYISEFRLHKVEKCTKKHKMVKIKNYRNPA